MKRGGMSRGSLLNRMMNQIEKDAIRALRKNGMEEEAKAANTERKANRVRVVPNRERLRAQGINKATLSGQPFARVTSGTRPAPASFHTLIAIHQMRGDGKIVKFVIPRDKLDKEEANAGS